MRQDGSLRRLVWLSFPSNLLADLMALFNVTVNSSTRMLAAAINEYLHNLLPERSSIEISIDVALELLLRVLACRRRKFTTSVQPAKAYEDESVIMSGPHSQWPKS